MSGAPLLNVAELARRGGRWRGTLPVGAFPRLPDVVGEAGEVGVELRLCIESERVRVQGECRIAAPIRCLRCLRTERVEVVAEVDFFVVATEAEAEALMPDFDVVVAAESAPATELIEDDLLMSVPEVACADRDPCRHAPLALSFGRDPQASPFAALRGFDAARSSGQ